MKVTTRPTAPSRRRREPDLSHRTYDVVGILLLAFALLTVVSLVLADTGYLGQALSGAFRLLFGKGAWILPFVFGGIGGALIAGQRKLEVSHLTIGICLFFVALLGVMAQTFGGSYFDGSVASSSGGYVGAVVAWVFGSLLGSAKVIGLGALMMMGLVFVVPAPIRSLLEMLKDRAGTLRDRPKSARPVIERPIRNQAVVQAEDRPTAPDRTDEPRKTRAAPIFRETQQFSSETLQSTNKEGYELPPLSLLADVIPKPKRAAAEMQQNIETLESTLEEFGIDANVVEVATGPTVTRYEIQLGPGIRVARITALADNIAMNLAASHVRVEAPIPGKAAIGVEVPNSQPTSVTLREVCDSKEFQDNPSRLVVCLGQDVSGINKYADLTRMPHLLIGGATNSGKSIGLASIIMSLLVRNTPKDLRFVMIDPKRVELSLFDNIPHLMCPVIKDVKDAPGVLRAVWREMDRRYDVFSERQVRNIDGWNEKATFQEKMPYIVVVIDELADLMIQAAAEVETSICRLAQLARATGIHLVIATQRPSVDVITGTIKANIASRIAFTVSSQIDSRTILDQKGAESLIGRGDMLFLPIDASKPLRVQGCYVSEKEIAAVCNFWRAQEKPAFILTAADITSPDKERGSSSSSDEDSDPLWEETVRWIVDRGQASTSMLQRRFSIGFQRASRMLDMMEERGIVGARDGPRPREVLITPMEVDGLFNGGSRYPAGETYSEEETRIRPDLAEGDW
jgi:S-DNA-T family DNA segregation ATPase FtsK/SpoIIIE